MAHTAHVLTHNDLARLRKLRDTLNAFVEALSPTAPLTPVKKPTGAAAHKKYLAKQQTRRKAPVPVPAPDQTPAA